MPGCPGCSYYPVAGRPYGGHHPRCAYRPPDDDLRAERAEARAEALEAICRRLVRYVESGVYDAQMVRGVIEDARNLLSTPTDHPSE